MFAQTTQESAPSTAQTANSFTGFAAKTAGAPRSPGARAQALTFTLLGATLILAALAGAWLQAPRPAALASPAAFAPGDPDWWRHPLESNPTLRLPAIQGNLRGVHALADGQRVWVVGEGGLILHSADGGATWRQQHPRPAAPAPAVRTTAWPGLIASAHAMEPPQQNVAPDVGQYNAAPDAAPKAAPKAASKPAPNASRIDTSNKLPASKLPVSNLPISTQQPIYKGAPPQQDQLAPELAKVPEATSAIEQRQQNVAPARLPLDKTAPTRPADAKKAAVSKAVKPKAPVPSTKPPAKPAPNTPATPPADTRPPAQDADLDAVYFLDARRGWAAGDQGMVWSTRDGGETWRPGFVGERLRIAQLLFDQGRILAIALGPSIREVPAGLGQSMGGRLLAIALVPSIRVYWNTPDADGWQRLDQLPPADRTRLEALLGNRLEMLRSGVYANASAVWRLDRDGTLRFAQSQAGPWHTLAGGSSSTPPARPVAIAYAGPERLWAVGDAGVIQHSADGGRTWRLQGGDRAVLAAQAQGAENRQYPAPWTWPTLLLGIGLMAVGGRQASRVPTAPSAPGADIIGLFVSDQPLKPGDTDHLGHTAIARGLADFIRNDNTEPGITLAVTGSWGSGKSSIMRLLEHDLKRAGFRPAWFNAWHHQQEGRQLASLFNAIRKQAVPAIHTPAAWRVRAALYWNRGWFYRLLALGVLGLFLLGLFEARDKQAPLTQLRQVVAGAVMDARPVVLTSASLEKLRKGGVLQPATLATLAGNMTWRPQAGEACREAEGDCRFDNLDQLYASVNRLMDPVRLTDEEKQALAEAAQHLGDQPRTMLGVLLGALVVPLLLGKGLAVYGLHYLDFLKRLLPERGKVEGKEAVGTMENFRTEFCHLTQALDGRLVLFIDDLDRCACETVREVLELVNYLVSVGRCFVVLGMAMEHVACCIPPKCPRQGADAGANDYALQYLKKLVNIEVPVPKAGMTGIRGMLNAREEIKPSQLDKEQRRLWVSWGWSLALLLALTWGMYLAWNQWHLEAQPKAFLTPAPTATEPPATPRPGLAPLASLAPQMPAGADAQPRGPVGLTPGAAAQAGIWSTLLGLLALAGLALGLAWPTRATWLGWLRGGDLLRAIRIALGGAERKPDTPAFLAALDGWYAVIAAGDPTPRGIKRFINRVRFLTMMEQALGSGRMPEGCLVGLAALHHAKVKLPPKLVLSRDTDWEALIPDDRDAEAAGRPSRAALALAIATACQATPDWPPPPKQIQHFLYMVANMHVR